MQRITLRPWSARPADLVALEIDGPEMQVPRGTTLLEAADMAGIWIPRLCHVHGAPTRAVCRLCLVAVTGMHGLVPACSIVVAEGMTVATATPEIRAVQKSIMEFHLLEHGQCGTPDCELELLAARLGATNNRFESKLARAPRLAGSEYIAVDAGMCVHCDRCIRVCYRDVIERKGRGSGVSLCFDAGASLADSVCTGCGDCLSVCPAGALRPRGFTTGMVRQSSPDHPIPVRGSSNVSLG